jgi:chromosome segregation ATPase
MRYNGGSFNSEKSRGGLYKQLADMGYSQPQIVRGINSGAIRIGKIKDGNFQDRTNNARKAQRQMDRLGRYASRQGDSTRSQDIETVYGENEQLKTQNQQLSTQVNNYQAAWSQITQEIDKVIALYTPAQSNPNESRISKKRTKILKEEEAAATVTASSQTGEAVEGLKDLLAKIAGIGKQITTLNGQLTQERRQRAAIQQQLNNANTSLKQYQQNTANTQAGAQQAATRNQTAGQGNPSTQTAVQGNTGAQTTQPKTQLKEQWKRMIQRMDNADL